VERDPKVLESLERCCDPSSSPVSPSSCLQDEIETCCQPCSCSERTTEGGPGLCVTKELGGEGFADLHTWACGCSEVCFSFEGLKVGRGWRTNCDGSTVSRQYRGGKPDGLSRRLGTSGQLESVGRWSGGRRAGTWWTRLEGGGWLVSHSKIDTQTFLYPNLSTALVGLIEPSGRGKPGEQLAICNVIGFASDKGLLVPQLANTGQTLLVGKDIPSSVELAPTVPDPYEASTVKVAPSLIDGAGGGLFSARSVREGELVAYFAGVTVEEGDAGDSEYAINWEGGARLDVPLGLRQQGYCATLGHMACHSFEPNIQYVWAVHPRFGRVRALRALKDLPVGEELLADYKYGLSKAPAWYRVALLDFLTQRLGVPALEAAATIRRMEASGMGAVRGQSHLTSCQPNILTCQPNLQVCQEASVSACQEGL